LKEQKSKFAEETKAVFEFGQKCRDQWQDFLTSVSSGRGERGINFKDRAGNRRAAETGVRTT
jgi:hypothetical protein